MLLKLSRAISLSSSDYNKANNIFVTAFSSFCLTFSLSIDNVFRSHIFFIWYFFLATRRTLLKKLGSNFLSVFSNPKNVAAYLTG